MVEEAKLKDYPTVLLFPGLGADSSLFTLQALAFPNLVTPDWITPLRNESLDAYLNRWLAQLEESGKLDRTKPIIVGGASFGGLIAQRAAVLLGAKHCILLGSIKESSEAPKRIRWLRPIHGLAFRWIILFWQWVIRMGLFCMGRVLSRRAHMVLSQFSRLDAGLVRWSIFQFYDCLDDADKRSRDSVRDSSYSFQIHQIHGAADRVFPPKRIVERDDTHFIPIDGAGHLFTVFAADQVNFAIEGILEQVTSAEIDSV